MKTNNKLLNNFLLDIKDNGNSDNTITGYERDIIQLINYIKEAKQIDAPIDNLDKDFFNKIDIADLKFFNNNLTQNNDKEATRSRKIIAIKGFFKYLYDLDIIQTNPTEKLTTPKLPERKPIYLDLDQSVKLLQTVLNENNHNRNKERDYAILTIFLNCGLRREEMIKIDIDHIKGDILTVIGKGNKERDVILTPACLNAINDYLKVRPDIDTKALFISEQHERISEGTITYLVKKYIEKAGLDSKKYSPHKLRHTAATLMYKHGGDIRSIQEILGHKSISTTQIYTHVDKEQQRKVANANPLSNM